MPRKTRARRTIPSSSPSPPSFDRERFPSEKNQELFGKLNLRRKIWAERSVLEFFSNISIRIYDSNTLVKSWIRGVEYTITPQVVADALGVPLVRNLVYPYDESPELSDVLSYITRTSVQWGSDPRITSAELSGLHYLFFRIACHSIWPICHVHTILLRGLAGEDVPDPVGDDVATTDVPPPPSADFDVRRTLETVMTVQAAHSQILVDLLDEIRALRADFARLHSPSPPPFDGDL
nr:hypothetical protein CFP56_00057 [Quercus suber]